MKKTKNVIILLLFLFAINFSYAQQIPPLAGIDTTDAFYQKNSLLPHQIKPWEDGMRSTGKSGTYEWWYFDGNLSDGSTLVIVFYTKSQMNLSGGLVPRVTFELTKPDGKVIKQTALADPKDFYASTDSCYVKVGNNVFSGNLKNYRIQLQMEDVQADIQLKGEVPAWRPASGFMTFHQGKESNYFAWLPSIPQGKIQGEITVKGQTQSIQGIGYHDHNWGDAPMMSLIHHWYWGRANVGNYSVIASYIVAEKKYGYSVQPILMLAKDGKIIAEDSDKIKFSTEDTYIDPNTSKPVANKLIYDYENGNEHYRVTFHRKKDLVSHSFVDGLKGAKKIAAKLAGFDGAYMRFTGEVTIEKLENKTVKESATEKSGVWEMMYFGKSMQNIK